MMTSQNDSTRDLNAKGSVPPANDLTQSFSASPELSKAAAQNARATPVQPAQPSPIRDDQIDSYRLLQPIGQGGMGSVWMAEQLKPIKRRVALKVIKTSLGSKEVLARFEIERQALAMMNHPNIARFYDAGTTADGQPYFAMELVQGRPLTAYCDENKLGIPERLRLFQEICDGVQHAHQKGIIHRDLKPGNILVGQVDGRATVKIIDFGLAKALESSQRLTDQSVFTGIGQILGTIKYMSPEQASLDNIDIDTRTDIYSLGVILYELLTGAAPLDDSSLKHQAVLKVLEFIQSNDPVRPSSKLLKCSQDQASSITGVRRTDFSKLTRILSGDLDWIVMKALEKDRARRYESASGFRADIARFLSGEPVSARPPSVSYRMQKFVRKHRAGVAAAALVFLALLMGVIGTSLGLVSANRAWKAEQLRAEAERLAKLESENRLVQIEKGNAILADMFKDLDVRDTANPDAPLEAVMGDRLIAVNRQLVPEVIGDQATLAKLKRQLAVSLINLGRWRDAEQILLEVLELQSQGLPPGHPEIFGSVNELGRVLLELADFRRAYDYLARDFDPNAPVATPAEAADILERLRLLGAVERFEGRFDESLSHLTKAQKLTLEAGSQRERWVSAIDNELATTHLALGNFDVAIPLFEQSLDLAKKVHGPFHQNTMERINNLASARRDHGDYEVAATLFEQVYEQLVKRRGKQHPETLRSLLNWGEVVSVLGDQARALPLLAEARQGMERALGRPHRDTVFATVHLAQAEMENQSYAAAAVWLEQALAAIQTQSAPDLATQMLCLEKLANCRWLLQDLTAAASSFESLLSLQKAEFGGEQLATLSTIGNLGILYCNMNQVERGLKLMENAYSHVATYPSLGSLRKELRDIYLAQGHKRAEQLIAEEIAELRQASKTSLDLAAEFTRLCSELLPHHRYRDCEPLLAEAFQIRCAEMPNDWRTYNTQSMWGEALVGQVQGTGEVIRGSETRDPSQEETLRLAGTHLVVAYQGLQSQAAEIPAHARAERITQALDRLINWAQLSDQPEELARWQAEKSRIHQ